MQAMLVLRQPVTGFHKGKAQAQVGRRVALVPLGRHPEHFLDTVIPDLVTAGLYATDAALDSL